MLAKDLLSCFRIFFLLPFFQVDNNPKKDFLRGWVRVLFFAALFFGFTFLFQRIAGNQLNDFSSAFFFTLGNFMVPFFVLIFWNSYQIVKSRDKKEQVEVSENMSIIMMASLPIFLGGLIKVLMPGYLGHLGLIWFAALVVRFAVRSWGVSIGKAMILTTVALGFSLYVGYSFFGLQI